MESYLVRLMIMERERKKDRECLRVEGIGKGVEVKAQMRRGHEFVRARLHFLICKVGTLLALIYLRIQEVIGMKFV